MKRLLKDGFLALHSLLRRDKLSSHEMCDRARKTWPADFTKEEIEVIEEVLPYTMTSPERLYSLIHAVRYITAAGIKGAIVECGVWKGGSMMAAALTLQRLNDCSRELHLFDTFAGMSEPGELDKDFAEADAVTLLSQNPKNEDNNMWALAPLNAVQKNLENTRYDPSKIHYVVGKVEDTLPAQAPDAISILRLDTDWYASTLHELVHLFPRLSEGGVLIIDDYGHWKGSRTAVDEYFQKNNITIFLNRIDYTGRAAIKHTLYSV